MNMPITKRIIFVCSGNICRSPMAEGLLKRALESADFKARVISMGTLGIFGQVASEFAVEHCRIAGVDISDHRSQGISFGVLAVGDIIVVMEEDHRSILVERDGRLKNKTHLFSSFLPDEEELVDIPDPIGSSFDIYGQIFSLLDSGVKRMVKLMACGML